jgi:alcohol oxidase
MPLYKELPGEIEEVDVILVGGMLAASLSVAMPSELIPPAGGTAACIIASRLSDAYPDLSILVLESGRKDDDPTITFPLLLGAHYDPNGQFMRKVQARPSNRLANRALTMPVANVLGGGSSVNMMNYSRGYRFDFDAWKMPGWSSQELLPYLRKVSSNRCIVLRQPEFADSSSV